MGARDPTGARTGANGQAVEVEVSMNTVGRPPPPAKRAPARGGAGADAGEWDEPEVLQGASSDSKHGVTQMLTPADGRDAASDTPAAPPAEPPTDAAAPAAPATA